MERLKQEATTKHVFLILDAKTVAAKWKNLRGKYNKCRKRLAALAQDPEKFHLFDQNKWTYYDDMAWLEPHMEVDVEQQQTDEPAER
jgi:hypothetical protein